MVMMMMIIITITITIIIIIIKKANKIQNIAPCWPCWDRPRVPRGSSQRPGSHGNWTGGGG